MPPKIRILILHDISVLRRSIAKILAAFPNLSVASISTHSSMLSYLIKHYKPNFILRSVGPFNSIEKALFQEQKTGKVLSIIKPTQDQTVRSDYLHTLSNLVLKEVKRSELTHPKNQHRCVKSVSARHTSSHYIEHFTEATPPLIAHFSPENQTTFSCIHKVIFCGASTGGTDALKIFLSKFPPNSPPILVTQHMPEGFTYSFAERLNKTCAIRVIEAIDRDPIRKGCAYIAPGHSHLYIEKIGTILYTRLSAKPPVNRHRPSVEVLFLSAATVLGENAIGVMFTGMGKDGATAMLKMREAGAFNIAQDEPTSVVFGMPREAIVLGAVQETLPLQQIAPRILEIIQQENCCQKPTAFV